MLETFVHDMINMIQGNVWIGPVFALIAGIITSVTPCGLSNIPLVTGFVTVDGDHEKRTPFFLSLTFAVGCAVTFTVLGILASVLGHVMHHSGILHIILGILMVVMALQMWGVVHIIPHMHGVGKTDKKDFIGAFFTGMVGGIFSSHCATPAILMLLTIASQSANYLWGAMLLVCYSIGHGIIIVVAGTSVALANKLEDSADSATVRILKFVLGLVMLLIGAFMLLGD